MGKHATDGARFSQSDVIHGISCCEMAMTSETWSPMEVYNLLQF
jgi:hypothetical protein